MDFHALQQKLFELDPSDPREDLARLQAAAQGSANLNAEFTVKDYVNESVEVAEGSLTLDRNYDIADFAALAGVVTERKQKPADQVRGSEPMPKAKPGRTEHPFKNRLVGEEEISELDVVPRGTASNTNIEQTLASIQSQLQTLSQTIQQLQSSVQQMSQQQPQQQTQQPQQQRQPNNNRGLGGFPAMQLNSKENKKRPVESIKKEGYDDIKSQLFAKLAEMEKKRK